MPMKLKASQKIRDRATGKTTTEHYYLKSIDWDVLAKEHPGIQEALEQLKVMETLCNQ